MFSGGRESSVPVPVSVRHCGTGAELSTRFGTSVMVPKCVGSEVSQHQGQ